jgi:murein DD-endopeptidase MepM/ murein hydrolase activator NlpD
MQQPLHNNEQKSKPSILTQNNSLSLRKISGLPKISKQNKMNCLGKIRLSWLFAILLLPVFGLVAAFSTSPPAKPNNVKIEVITEDVTLPLAVDALRGSEEFWQIDTVRREDTLESLFKRMGVRDEDAVKFLTLSQEAKALNTQLIPGHTIEIKTNSAGKLLHIEYEVDTETILIAVLTKNGYQVATQKLLLQSHQMLASGKISDSLFSATDDAGIPDAITLQIADIFSGEIDFVEDIHAGDTLNVVYEGYYNAGELMKTGNVLAVEYINQGKKYTAIRFGEAEGKYAYYTVDGKSLHKSFLRSPVEFSRVSSTFSSGRFHPILHRLKAHKGVDFAAPIGTRIKAASDGIVDFVGNKGGYGNAIVLKHDNGISTVYGHLSGFAAGLQRGQQISQGDIIGFVGMTGLATGPHLHYEFLVHGVHRDPLTVALPTNIPIDAKLKPDFEKIALHHLTQLAMLQQRQVVSMANKE